MNNKNAAGMIVLAAFLFAAPVSAQEQQGGIFYKDCGPTDGPAVTIELDSHLRMSVYEAALKPDEAYRSKTEVIEGERENLSVHQCDNQMENCKAIEGLITMHIADDDNAEGAIEVFDGTETQGDSESIQGTVHYFKVKRDKKRTPPQCG